MRTFVVVLTFLLLLALLHVNGISNDAPRFQYRFKRTKEANTKTASKYCLTSKTLTDAEIKETSSRTENLLSIPAKDTDPKYVQMIYQIIKDFTELCDRNGVTYYAEGGTLLGSVRDKGLIRWDDDGDFGVPITHESKLTGLKSLFTKLGYGMRKWYYGYKIFYLNGDDIPDAECEGGVKPFKYPFLDIFISDVRDGQTFLPRSNLWPECYFLVNELNPISDCPFGPLTIKCAAQPEQYLNRCYGNNWRSHGQTGKDHIKYSNENDAPKTFSLSGTALALPTHQLEDHVDQNGNPL